MRLPRRFAPRNDTNECNTPKVDSPEFICSYIRFALFCGVPQFYKFIINRDSNHHSLPVRDVE